MLRIPHDIITQSAMLRIPHDIITQSATCQTVQANVTDPRKLEAVCGIGKGGRTCFDRTNSPSYYKLLEKKIRELKMLGK
jgi:hypothetical protein